MRLRHQSVTVATVVVLLLGVGCGGDDGSSTNRLSDEEFCAKVADVEALGDAETNSAESVAAVIDELIDSAPNDELQDALRTLQPIIAEVEGVDENDPDAFGKVMDLMMDPDVIKAGEVIEKYSSEVCGITDDTLEDSSGGNNSIDMGQSGSILDDLDATDLSEFLETNGADLIANGRIDSTSIELADGYSKVIVDIVDVESLDAVAVCEIVAEGVFAMTTDTAVEITVRDTGVDAALREVDGECAPA